MHFHRPVGLEFVEVDRHVGIDLHEGTLDHHTLRIGKLGLVAVQVVSVAGNPFVGQVAIKIGHRQDVDVHPVEQLPTLGRAQEIIGQHKEAFGRGRLVAVNGTLQPDLDFRTLGVVVETVHRNRTAFRRGSDRRAGHAGIPGADIEPGHDLFVGSETVFVDGERRRGESDAFRVGIHLLLQRGVRLRLQQDGGQKKEAGRESQFMHTRSM